ncbi:MAG: immune inhibitor A, partial [Candidatus Cloacimonadaceae bacterium]|nr:immune inhibitor A [Candidatus Cloacimonadaceae bacterium]
YHEAANLIVGETHIVDDNGNGVVEPGETVHLGIQLTNSGNALADNIEATLTIDDPFVTISSNTSEYFPMEGEHSSYNKLPFIFTVSPDCPNGRVITFVLTITSGEVVWTRNISMRVDASVLAYKNYLVSDFDATFDGFIDNDETVKLIVNLANNADVESRNVVGNLSTDNPFVSIHNPEVAVAIIPANSIMQLVYTVTFNAGITPNTYVTFNFNATASNGQPMSTPINVPFSMPGAFYDFELDNGGYTAETGWVWGTPTQVTPYSGTKVWCTGLSGNYPDYVEFNLYTPIYVLTENPSLSFMHNYGIENNFDGANVSISTNGGSSWVVITPTGGYTHNSLPGLNGQPGYSGNSAGWQPATFYLSSYQGQEAMFRFKFGSDGQVSSIGWFIDNVQLNGISNKVGHIYGEVIPTSGLNPKLANVITHTRHATHPDENGMYRIYLKNGHYSANAYMDYHQSSSNNNLVITAENITRQADFTLIHLPKPLSINYTVDNDTGAFVLNWSEP